MLLSLTATAALGENYCPFNPNALNSPCNSGNECDALPDKTGANYSAPNSCISKITNYCSHSSRTRDLDPGCYHYNNITMIDVGSPSPSPSLSSVGRGFPSPSSENPFSPSSSRSSIDGNFSPSPSSSDKKSAPGPSEITKVPSPAADQVPSPIDVNIVPSPVDSTPSPKRTNEPSIVPSPTVDETKSFIKVSISLNLPPTANITMDELQSKNVKDGLELQLAEAIGIDAEFVTITAIYLCPGDIRCTTTTRRLKVMSQRRLNGEEKRIVVEFEIKADEEVVQQAERNMAKSGPGGFQETLSSGASKSLSKELNKDIEVTASKPTTLSRTVGKEPTLPDEDIDNNNQSSLDMPEWFLPVIGGVGGLICISIVALLVKRKRDENKIKKSIRPYLESDGNGSNDFLSSDKNKKKRGRETGANFGVAGVSKLKKSSPYSVPTPEKVTPNGQSPYATSEKPKFSPMQNNSNRSKYATLTPAGEDAGEKEEKHDEKKEIDTKTLDRRKLPPLRGARIPKSNVPAIGPGSPVALPSPSAVNRYRAFQAEKRKKEEQRRKEREERLLKEQKEDEAHAAAGTVPPDRAKRRRSVSPSAMTKEQKSEMLEKYKAAHKKMYASVKEKLKAEHLERLQKLNQLKKEEEMLRNGNNSSSSPTATTADISGEKKEEVVAKESKSTTEIAVGAASAVVGKVSDETRAKMLKAAEDNAPKKSREEVLKGYKEEHRRMRAQMKAKLKAEYMNRLRRDREQKKKKLAAKKIIEGE